MNKKLLAVAVAGALAAPGVALAQSSVTISGVFKLSVENLKMGDYAATRPAGSSSSQTRMVDDSSAIRFGVVEDLGGGLAAIAQLDIRFKMDDTGNQTSFPNVGGVIPAGNTWVGLRSKQWGQLRLGRQDVHYFNTESYLTAKGALRADSTSLLSYIQGTAIANASRTQNIIWYQTPNWSGFTVIAGYSTNAAGADADLGNAGRKGNAWVLNPNFEGRNFQIGYSHFRSKADASQTTTCPAATVTVVNNTPAVACGAGGVTSVTAAAEQRGDRLYGSYAWGGLRVGLAWDKSRLKNNLTGVESARRTAWSLPIGYVWGPHEVHGHYTKARDDKVSPLQDGAKMIALAYAYNLSKRTALAFTYAKIRNDAGATYNLFTSTSLGDLNGAVVAGEDPRILAFTVRHAF